VFKGKYVVMEFEIQRSWAGPYFGLDFGFSVDPTAACRLHIDDQNKVLFVSAEYWALRVDIDKLPAALEAAIPGISQHVVYGDSARPESISFLARYGIPRATAAEKWSGSIEDGIAHLRSYQCIVIHPSCTHFIEEARLYSYKVDRLSGDPLPDVRDAHNHLWDAARYALSPLIRGGGFRGDVWTKLGEDTSPFNQQFF
jgi:phage terminase large subunit